MTIHATSSSALTILGNSERLQATADRLRTVARALRPVLIVALVAGTAGWLAVAVNAIVDAVSLGGAVITAVSLTTLTALALPWLIDQARREADAYARGFAAEERAAATLHAVLNGEWTLLRSLHLPGVAGDIDAVLIGPGGLYCLEIKGYSGVIENRKDQWVRHRADGHKTAIRPNPAEQLNANCAALNRFLQQEGSALRGVPRLFYAGEGGLLLEDPATPVWDANRPDEIAYEINQSADHLDTPSIATVIALLRDRIPAVTDPHQSN